MMGAFGFQRNRATNVHQVRFLRQSAIIISNESIPASETWRRATSRHEPRRKFVTKAAVSARAVAAYTWILPTQLPASARTRFANVTEIFFTSTRKLRA